MTHTRGKTFPCTGFLRHQSTTYCIRRVLYGLPSRLITFCCHWSPWRTYYLHCCCCECSSQSSRCRRLERWAAPPASCSMCDVAAARWDVPSHSRIAVAADEPFRDSVSNPADRATWSAGIQLPTNHISTKPTWIDALCNSWLPTRPVSAADHVVNIRPMCTTSSQKVLLLNL